MTITLTKKQKALVVGGLLMSWLTPLHAQINVSLDASRDASLYSENDLWANGAGDHLFAGRIANDTANRRAMIYFDIASMLPAGATILNAELQLLLNNKPTFTDTAPFSIHSINSAWSEGPTHPSGEEGIGIEGSPGDSTWLYSNFSNATWLAAGGDFNPTASASLLSGDLGSTNIFSSAQTIGDVQTWLDNPSQNFGWMLLGDESTARSARRFASRENAIDTGPQLVLTYQIPEANSLLLLFLGLGILYKYKTCC